IHEVFTVSELSSSPPGSVGPRGREAYATVLHSSDTYLCGAIVLAQSIRRSGSTRDLVLLHDHTLTEYSSVVFVDADILVLRNLDALFRFPQLTAVGNDGSLFNSGVMLIEPSACTFDALVRGRRTIRSYNGGDQGFLNEAFVWWHRLPRRVNYLKNFWANTTGERALKEQLFGADPPEVWSVHYLGMKPWTCYRDYDCNWNVGPCHRHNAKPHCVSPPRLRRRRRRCSAAPLLVLPAAATTAAAAGPRGRAAAKRLLHCGSAKEVQGGSIKWIPDDGFTAVGNVSAIDKPNLLPVLATLRYFPDATARKYCYQLPAVKGTRYLVRTTYFDGGTRWSAVNTTDNYRRGMSTYFEVVAQGQGKTMSVCLARRPETASSPFISALEIIDLYDSMYITTDYEHRGAQPLRSAARARSSDDPYNRYWAPFADANPMVESHSSIAPGDFWNQPPAKALKAGVTTSRGKKLTVQWPPVELPAATYYVALYFQDSRTASPYSWRVFDVAINGQEFFNVRFDLGTVMRPNPRESRALIGGAAFPRGCGPRSQCAI
ncbi:hypothetical protein U9M48_006791, partial [Paspalum notatum var. saurae]